MNPYSDNESSGFSGMDLFGNERILERFKPSGKRVASERAELIGYFAKKLGWENGRVIAKIGHLKELRDLYYMKSVCDGYEREGKGPWGKAFNGMLRVR